LSDGPHGHESAITAARQTEPILIDGCQALRRIDPGKDVAQIAAAKIANVGLREALALAKAAARIGLELEVTERSPLSTTEARAGGSGR